jgi:hypothetical protein
MRSYGSFACLARTERECSGEAYGRSAEHHTRGGLQRGKLVAFVISPASKSPPVNAVRVTADQLPRRRRELRREHATQSIVQGTDHGITGHVLPSIEPFVQILRLSLIDPTVGDNPVRDADDLADLPVINATFRNLRADRT